MEKLKEALLIVIAVLIGIGGTVLWVLGLIKKKASEKELEDLRAKLEAERKAKADAQKAAIDGKTPKEIIDSFPSKEKDAIDAVVDSHTTSAVNNILEKLRKRSVSND